MFAASNLIFYILHVLRSAGRAEHFKSAAPSRGAKRAKLEAGICRIYTLAATPLPQTHSVSPTAGLKFIVLYMCVSTFADLQIHQNLVFKKNDPKCQISDPMISKLSFVVDSGCFLELRFPSNCATC